MSESERKDSAKPVGLGIVFGAGIGAGIGIVLGDGIFGDTGTGLTLGAAIGLALGIVLGVIRKKKISDAENSA